MFVVKKMRFTNPPFQSLNIKTLKNISNSSISSGNIRQFHNYRPIPSTLPLLTRIEYGSLLSKNTNNIHFYHRPKTSTNHTSTIPSLLINNTNNGGLRFNIHIRTGINSGAFKYFHTTSKAYSQSTINPDTTNTKKPATSNGHKELLRLLKLAKYDWKLLSVALILLIFSCVIGMLIPKVIGMVLDATKDAVFNNDNNSDHKITSIDDMSPIIWGLSMPDFLWVVAGALIIGQAASFGRVVLLRILGEKLVARLRANVMKKTLHQDAEFFDRNKVGDLISRLSSDAYVVSRSMTQNISDGCKAVICGGVGIGMMLNISTSLSGALFIFAPILLFGASLYGKRIRIISKKLQESTGNLTRVAEEQLSGVKTIQSFVAEGKELHRYDKSIRQVFHVGRTEAFTNATFFSSTNMLADISFLIVLAYGSHLVLQGGLTIGDLTAFMIYTEYTGNAMYGLSNFYSELMKGAGAASRLFELTDRKPVISSTKGEHFITRDFKCGSSIRFENVSFSYPTRPGNKIFSDLTFNIEAGSNVCFVGPSGRGKSTITSLLLKYYLPSTGTIYIDGQDINKISAKSLRRSLGVVQQEPILMSGTVRDNIAYGLDYKPTLEEIRGVAKKAFCFDFITKFPQGFDTVIGARGALLSGGQKQRISIARALLKKPKILILDEATSALDVESEGAINYTLGQLMKSKECTIISIAHRLSTIRRSENVIVLGNDGSVVETGKFKELYAKRDSALFKLLNEPKKLETLIPSPLLLKSGDINNNLGDPAYKESEDKSTVAKQDSDDKKKNNEEDDFEVKKAKDEVIEHVYEDINSDQKSSQLRP
ncbi:ATP-binding cassette permease MDL2 SCDLUD_000960 [Saccharomycodes ludwigii]|uniref:ATP-binding cassette permease MDL2 n=1 Tax=Saccharomycodes ludwigii TaxID=36035 RepID=UPI001E8C37A9|nr:hypothetical protein SCDLUD_000960 [Saccharomycodes ludwigii]KAH3903334.1 hypothetical protein SCDLUD_000960 [Saccharomycodes ludwigii]